MNLKIKKLHVDAVIPRFAKPGDAGLDLTATSKRWDDKDQCYVYGVGLAFEIEEGYVGLIFPRSSLSKYDLILSNHVGVIDSGFRGEVTFKFRRTKESANIYYPGDKIGQLVIQKLQDIHIEEVDELSTTERGEGGYGSTGK